MSGAQQEPLRLHARCEVLGIGMGEILFMGQTSFSPGLWVGIELDEPVGKNNGTVQNKRYFECREDHGMFVRPPKIVMLPPEEQDEDLEEGSLFDEDEGDTSLMDEEMPPPTLSPRKAPSPVKRALPGPRLSVASRTPLPASTAARPRSSVAGSSTASARTPATRLAANASPIKNFVRASSAISRTSSPTKPGGTGTPQTRPGSSVSASSSSAAYASARSAGASLNPSRSGTPGTATVRAGAGPSGRLGGVKATPRAALAPGSSTGRVAARSSLVPPSSSRPAAPPLAAARAKSNASTSASAGGARAGLRPVMASRPSMRPTESSHATAATIPKSRSAGAAEQRTEMTRGAGVAPTARHSLATSRRSGPPSVVSGRESVTSAGSELETPSAPRRTGASLAGAGIDVASRRVPVRSTTSNSASAAAQASEAEVEDDLMNVSMDESEAMLGADGDADVEETGDLQSPSVHTHARSSSDPRKLRGTLSPSAMRDHMSLGPSTSLASSATPGALAAVQREVEELKAKLRMAERRKEEDREKIKEMEKSREESEEMRRDWNRLNAKQSEMQGTLRDLEKLEKDWELQKDDLERQLVDMTEQLEMATLDREVAEERAEAALAELDSEKMRAEELAIELEVFQLQEENARDLVQQEGDGDITAGAIDTMDPAKASKAYMQVEKQNERLKDALIRLRDITSETDAEQRKKIADLDRELTSLNDLQSAYEAVRERLDNAEALVEDLKQQLDACLDAEEKMDEMMTRLIEYQDKVQEQALAIEDLTAICEVNDELEEQHVETEKQLQEEVDLAEFKLRDSRARIDALEANLIDYESTFGNFRTLVDTLQNDVEQLRSEQQSSEQTGKGESGKLTSQSQAVLNLNLQLQSSVLKSQAKTIDLELGKLSAAQATQHLDMVRPYLPQAYFDSGDVDAVASLLFFRRMAHKADLLKMVVESQHDIAKSLTSVIPDSLVSVCQFRHSLAHFAALSRQMASNLELATVTTFLKAGRMYRDLASVEKRMDSFIEAQRREELREADCGKEIQRFVGQFEEFMFALDDGTTPEHADLAAKELGSAQLLDHDLDTLAASLGYAKQAVAALWDDAEVEWDLAGRSVEADVFDPFQRMLDNVRSAKIPARKFLHRLNQLYNNHEAVRMDAVPTLPSLGQRSSKLVAFAIFFARSMAEYAQEVRTSKAPFVLRRCADFVREARIDVLGSKAISSSGSADGDVMDSMWTETTESFTELAQTIHTLLASVSEADNIIKVLGPGPWLSRVEQIKSELSHNVEAERRITTLTEEGKDLYRQIKTRDQTLGEAQIKIERLVKQLERSREDGNDREALRANLADVQRQAKTYQQANETLQADIDALEQAHDTLKQQHSQMIADSRNGLSMLNPADADAGSGAPGSSAGNGSGILAGGLTSSASGANLETTYLADQLDGLRAAVRHLRTENAYLKSVDTRRELYALPPIFTRSPTNADSDTAVADTWDRKEEAGHIPLPARPAASAPASPAAVILAATAQSKSLYADLLRLASAPRLVDLSYRSQKLQVLNASTDTGSKEPVPHLLAARTPPRQTWHRAADLPENQYRASKLRAEGLARQVRELEVRVREARGSRQQGHGGDSIMRAQPMVNMKQLRVAEISG